MSQEGLESPPTFEELGLQTGAGSWGLGTPRAEEAGGLRDEGAEPNPGPGGHKEAALHSEPGSASTLPNLGLWVPVPALLQRNRCFTSLSLSCLICRWEHRLGRGQTR